MRTSAYKVEKESNEGRKRERNGSECKERKEEVRQEERKIEEDGLRETLWRKRKKEEGKTERKYERNKEEKEGGLERN